jgi:hypothetical protein
LGCNLSGYDSEGCIFHAISRELQRKKLMKNGGQRLRGWERTSLKHQGAKWVLVSGELEVVAGYLMKAVELDCELSRYGNEVAYASSVPELESC